MKRRNISLILVLIAIVAAFKFCNSKPPPPKEEKQGPLGFSENSGTFNQSYDSLLNAYYALKDALVASDTTMANTASKDLLLQAEHLKVSEIKGDTSGTIQQTASLFKGSISSLAEGFSAEKNIGDKRKQFEMISDAVWSLTRTVRYDNRIVYYQYCPMAFNNKGAYWLSDKREILNPYFGKEMLNCGEIADSLDYSKR